MKYKILKPYTFNPKPNKGFTLIEVLVVIFIIGLLASVVLVGLGSFRARGRDARRVADLRQVQQGLELYYAGNGQYPPSGSWSDLTSQLIGASIGVTQVPNDPQSGKDYKYGVDANQQSYILGADLEETGSGQGLLRDDVDGTLYGINCNDPIYCIQQ